MIVKNVEKKEDNTLTFQVESDAPSLKPPSTPHI